MFQLPVNNCFLYDDDKNCLNGVFLFHCVIGLIVNLTIFFYGLWWSERYLVIWVLDPTLLSSKDEAWETTVRNFCRFISLRSFDSYSKSLNTHSLWPTLNMIYIYSLVRFRKLVKGKLLYFKTVFWKICFYLTMLNFHSKEKCKENPGVKIF